MTIDTNEQHKLRIADATRDANYSMWNALLTLNGVVISAFSAVAVFSPIAKVLAVTIMAASMVSALLLILNFRSTRDVYRRVGQLKIEGVGGVATQERKEQLAAANKAHRRCNIRETTALVILGIQSLLIFVLVCFKS